jgi:hypothetical protein
LRESRCGVVGAVAGGVGLASCAWALTATVTAKTPKVAHPRKCNILNTPFQNAVKLILPSLMERQTASFLRCDYASLGR